MSKHLCRLKSRCPRAFRGPMSGLSQTEQLNAIANPLPNGIISDSNIECPTWYSAWLIARFRDLPAEVLAIFHTINAGDPEADRWNAFASAFAAVGESVCSSESITIDGIVQNLQEKDLILEETTHEQSKAHHQIARYFVFCVLGWQAMLFNPGPVQPAIQPPHQLAIEEQEGYCEYTHMALCHEARFCERETLDEFLIGYGLLLPSKNMCLNESPDVQRAFHEQVEIESKFFNAHNLISIAGLRIKWVDYLACHMELNSITMEISLFRFPSFCQLARSSYKCTGRGAIHTYGTTSRLRCQWATQEEVNQLLLEILRSYRLLFGQTKKSRVLFRSLKPNSRVLPSARDPLLEELCSKKTCDVLSEAEKDNYYLPQNFPVLRYRIMILERHLKKSAPQTWSQLWRDKRDSANWLTFWAVIFFGAFGSLMAFLQVLLQLIQMIKEA